MKKETKLSQGALRALEMLKENKDGLTVADMKEKGFENVNSAHLVALKSRGLVDSVEVTIEVPTVIKRKVQLYTVIQKD